MEKGFVIAGIGTACERITPVLLTNRTAITNS